ncbi:MAG: DUF4270 domain-containing protein [Bacteroidales bacterium]|jgi:hypothetical protein|nr:DUF4270 domain-containing protein [Bacteroidales bacterium]
MIKLSIQAFVMLIAIAIFSASCTDNNDLIGLNIQPPGEELKYFVTDTFSVFAYSVREDSVKTDKLGLSLLGSMFDPVFGKTTASIYTELRLTSLQLNFGEGAVIDSIILKMAYVGVYGDSSTMQTFRVYEMTENIDIDSSYYSNKITAYGSQIGFEQIIPPVDSIPVDTIKIAPSLRIPLNDGGILAEKLLSGTSDDYSSNEKFREFFKGIYITADPVDEVGKGALLTYNLISDATTITVYYHNFEKDSLKYNFTISNASGRYGHYYHYGYADAEESLRQQIISGDTTLGSNKIYLQPLGGVKTYLRFPTITSLGTDISINEAKLILTDNDPSAGFTQPPRLSIGKLTDDKGKTTILDDQFEGETYFGGYYKDSEYTFRLSRYVQDRILNKDAEDFGLTLLVPAASSVPHRVVLNGTNTDAGKIRLVITYTKL